MENEIKSIEEAARKLIDQIEFMRIPGHVGVGDEMLFVFCERKRDVPHIPTGIGGYPVKVEYVGKIKPAKDTP